MTSVSPALLEQLEGLFETVRCSSPAIVSRQGAPIHVHISPLSDTSGPVLRYTQQPAPKSAHEKMSRVQTETLIAAQVPALFDELVATCPAFGCRFADIEIRFTYKGTSLEAKFSYRGRRYGAPATTPEELAGAIAELRDLLEGFRPGPHHFQVQGMDYTAASAVDALHAWAVSGRRSFASFHEVMTKHPPTVTQIIDPHATQGELQARFKQSGLLERASATQG